MIHRLESRRVEGEGSGRRRVAEFLITCLGADTTQQTVVLNPNLTTLFNQPYLGLLSSIFFWIGGWNILDAYFFNEQVTFLRDLLPPPV